MGNTITSKNSWELLLSSVTGAFDGADHFILGTFDEAENYAYKTIITNHRTNEEISKYITAIKLTIPDTGDKISSIKATFDLEELIVQNDDYVTIKILNSTESAEITVLKGKIKILKRDINTINLNQYSVEIVDEFSRLFEKIVTEDIFLFDKYIYSEQYKENSILYIIAKKLGFTDEQMNFEDVRDSQSRLVKIPFILFRKNNRYVDELQTLLDVTKGRIYIDNMEQIVFENGLFEYEKAIIYPFDIRNILKNVGVNYKYTDKNGVRVLYDSYKYLANQVIFDLVNKVEVLPGTTTTIAKELVIKFITDLATQHNITRAEGYYYENEEQIRVFLLQDTHYEVIEFSETLAKVKFLNPYASKLYIDKFEIKGIPLAMFSDNEVSVKATKDMLENEENFSSYNKNKYIQTEELASDIARVEYIRNCKNKKEYNFKSNYVPHLEPGDICTLKINDIDTFIQISTIEHTLSRVNGFYSEIVALEYEKIEQEFNYSKLESLTAKDSFLGTLNNIKDQVDETDKKLEEVILIEGARGYVDEKDPRDSGKTIAEPDVWFNPVTKEFKVWRNGKWNPAKEEDIPPALMTALKAQAGIFRIGGNDTEAGIFFQYDKDTKNPVFGATDSENIAQVSIDRKANVLIRNANNKLAFNMRDPENPSKIISQLIMGVYNADDGERHKNTLFQVGDESTGTYIKFTRGNIGTIVYDGKEVKEHIDESKADALEALDKLDKIASDSWLTTSEKVTLEKEWEEIKQEFPKIRDRGTTYKVNVQAYINSKNALDAYLLPMLNAENFFKDTQINRIEFNSKFTNYYDTRTNIFVAIEEKVKELADNAQNTGDSALNNQNNGIFTVNANTVFDGKATFISKGSNETTVIKDGSITFTRAGQDVTVIRNMRAGMVTTDGNGSGYVDFTNMKNNLVVLPSVKAFNVSANVRSLNCRAEKDPNFLAQNRYKFYVYGTEEVVTNTQVVESNSSNWSISAYTAGAVSIILKTGQNGSGYNTGYLGETSDGMKSLTMSWDSQMVIGIKTYIDNAYYGEIEYYVPNSCIGTYMKENGHFYVLTGVVTLNPTEIAVNGVTKTTIDKTDKTVRYEYYIKNYGVIRSSYTTNGNRHRSYTSIVVQSTIRIDFVKGKYQYAPTYIQNIVGGGEVHYLVIEQ